MRPAYTMAHFGTQDVVHDLHLRLVGEQAQRQWDEV